MTLLFFGVLSHEMNAIGLITTPGSVNRSKPVAYEILEDTTNSADSHLYSRV